MFQLDIYQRFRRTVKSNVVHADCLIVARAIGKRYLGIKLFAVVLCFRYFVVVFDLFNYLFYRFGLF
jgi:hypothetical protein